MPTRKYPDGRRGTTAGRGAHLRAGEPVCDDCRRAYRDAKHARRKQRATYNRICEKPSVKYPNGRTGTAAGVGAHRMAHEPPCADCAQAATDSNPTRQELAARLLREAVAAQPHTPRTGWRDDASCKGLSGSMFILDVGESPIPAQKVCLMCPVRIDCATANVSERIGIWGGLGQKARRQLAKTVRQAGG